ncbi:hypothetical protein Back11_00550 [Paenibacillus baekrokdamisoli]|uniref:Uncharacterized protein n=1 Tax=Paenibacillus baekrokdamisoli TaxID=1712516 RepID=A0A3G9IIA9_9BACL|nr:LytTR family DNA-binding domain-containing protein [Paenibacillus baekrokdamisoli]MBB3069320.1 DNA-binding LytR/AlgR family response regulator [Paenibacillus baekrokdamisoli]BBH18710.1 hypothetical protein Back11_00550 [Paenibacillus baekrokdamisoli]
MKHKLSVVSKIDGSGGLQYVDLNEVIYFESMGSTPQIVVHTLTEEFYIWGTLKVWTNVLKESGYEEFFSVDRNYLINIRKVKRLDDQYKMAYFEYEISKGSKVCTLAWEKYKSVSAKLRALNQPFIQIKSNDDKMAIILKIKEATSHA